MGEYSNIMLASSEEWDSAKRLSDIVNSICVYQPLDVVLNSWIAARLSDGGTDGNLYDSRREAVRHQVHPTQCAYLSLRFAPAGMPVQEAHAFLKFTRDAYDNGMMFIDPEHPTGGLDTQMPITVEDVNSQMLRLHTRKRKVR